MKSISIAMVLAMVLISFPIHNIYFKCVVINPLKVHWPLKSCRTRSTTGNKTFIIIARGRMYRVFYVLMQAYNNSNDSMQLFFLSGIHFSSNLSVSLSVLLFSEPDAFNTLENRILVFFIHSSE